MLFSIQRAYKHYLRVISRWPKDALRPEVQFQDAILRRINRRFLPNASPEASKEASASSSSSIPVNEQAELDQVNVLYSLLENRYSKKVFLSADFNRAPVQPALC